MKKQVGAVIGFVSALLGGATMTPDTPVEVQRPSKPKPDERDVVVWYREREAAKKRERILRRLRK